MRGRLVRILDIGTAPEDDADLVLRKRTNVATILVICLGFLTFTVTALVTDRPAVVALTLVVLLGQALNLVLFSRTKRIGVSAFHRIRRVGSDVRGGEDQDHRGFLHGRGGGARPTA